MPQLSTPIVLIIFNRPDTLRKVFEAIRCAQPSKLLVIADGPRPEVVSDARKCAAARTILERVDWKCEVLTHYSEINLGCKWRVSSGLDWVFKTVAEAIILEDDCLPHPTFFPFCEELLERYREDERVMAISGDNFQFGHRRTEDSYYFSRYNHCWGWATWRRAWRHYDVEMKLWPVLREGGWLKDILGNHRAAFYWRKRFQAADSGTIDTWAYRWTLACWLQSGLSILPNVNLVSNIGFNAEATHTKSQDRLANLPLEKMDFPLLHPQFLIRNAQSDDFTQSHVFDLGVFGYIRRKAAKILKR